MVTILIVANLLGMLITRFSKHEKNSITYNLLSGIILIFGLFQLIALPAIFVNMPFNHLIILYIYVLVVLCLLSVFYNKDRWKLIFGKVLIPGRFLLSLKKGFNWKKWKIFVLEKTNWVLLLVLFITLIQVIMHLRFEFGARSGDDLFLVGTATTTMYTNQLFRYNPFTGLPIPVFFEQYVLSPYPIFAALVSRIFDIHPILTIRTLLPMISIILFLCSYFQIGKILFSGDYGKAVKFIFYCQVVILFSGVGLGSIGYFALLRLHLGDSLLYVVLLPLYFYFYMRISNQDSTKVDWIMLVMLLIASSMVSNSAIVLSLVTMGIIGIVHFVHTRKIKEMIYIGLCCIPNILLAFMFVLSTSSRF